MHQKQLTHAQLCVQAATLFEVGYRYQEWQELHDE